MIPAKVFSIISGRFSRTIWSISLTLCAETETFHLEQSIVARPKQTRRATELLVHLRVKTHERTLKHTSLWLGRKTQRFSGTNQMPEQLQPFGTSHVRLCPQGLFCPDLKSTPLDLRGCLDEMLFHLRLLSFIPPPPPIVFCQAESGIRALQPLGLRVSYLCHG